MVALYACAQPMGQVKPISRMQAVSRDIALVMPDAQPLGPVMDAIREAAGELMPRVVSERRSGWGRTRVDSLGRVTVTPLADDPHTMPDVRGMGLKEAVFLLESRGLRVAFTGKGAVREQTLPPGAKIQRGQTVTLKLR